MRTALVVTCLLASNLLAAGAAAKEPPKAKVEPKQFIDRSIIVFPGKVGDYTVDTHEQDPGVFGGVSVGYFEPKNAPRSFTVSAYVYPIGRMPTDEALAAGIEHVVGGIKGTSNYTDVKVDPVADFSVAAPDMKVLDAAGRKHQTVVAPSGEPAPKEPATEADMTAAMAELGPPTTTAGRRVVIHMDRDGVAVRSVGYVFYRQLMLVKLRITAAAADLDEAAFLALADEAARTLAPSFLVQNVGDCGVARIPMDGEPEDDKSDGKSGAVALMREMGRMTREGCEASEGEPLALPEGMLQHTLVYPDGTWK